MQVVEGYNRNVGKKVGRILNIEDLIPGSIPHYQMRGPSVVLLSKVEHLKRFLGKVSILKMLFSY